MANLEERKKHIQELIDKAEDAIEKGDLETARQLKSDIESQKKEYEELSALKEEVASHKPAEPETEAEKVDEEVDNKEDAAEEEKSEADEPKLNEPQKEVEEQKQEEVAIQEDGEDAVANAEKLEDDEEEKKKKKGAKRDMAKILNNEVETNERVEGFADFIKTKGAKREKVISDDVGVTIPEDIKYTPEKEVNTVQDLSQYVTKTSVKTASGKHPIVKRATAKFSTVAELEQNPELAKPDFETVSWEVNTYRGAIPVSEESIADSAINLTALIAENIQEQKVNTLNEKIGNVLKSFTAKEVSDVDALKAIINVDLDPAYERQIVCTQSFYQALDTLKDGNGRYYLNDSIINTSGLKLLGMNVTVVRDDLLGLQGEAKAFVGDLKRGVFFADRSDLSVTWQDHNIYGRFLMGAFRFDVKKADENAGYFITFNGDAGEETP